MGSTNYGSQSLTFDYKQNATSELFNKLNYKLHDIGIYEGGLLTKVNDTTVQISPLLVFIQDSANEVGIRIDTQNSINFTVSTILPYVVLRFVWVNAENNYMDVVATDEVGLQADDIIIGKCIFDGSVMRTIFDYSKRTEPYHIKIESEESAFDVNPKDPASNQVEVTGGTAFISGRLVELASGDSPTISSTTLGRIDLIYIDYGGNIIVIEGVDSGSPVIPDYPSDGMVIAKITRGASKTVIEGSEIELIRPSKTWTSGFYSSDDTPLIYLDNSNNYIGIGFESPSELFHIKSTGNSTIELAIERNVDANNIIELGEGSSGEGQIILYDSSNNSDIYLNAEGDSYFINEVGFGTDTPLTNVHIQGSDVAVTPESGTLLTLENNGNTILTMLGNNSTGKCSIFFGDADDADIGQINYNHQNNYMSFFTNTAERLRIDQNGNIGIGSTDIESWGIGFVAIEFPYTAIINSKSSSSMYLGSNFYYDTGWKYKSTEQASLLVMDSTGTIVFRTAVSGTIDTAITWDYKFKIDNATDSIGIGGYAGGSNRDSYLYFSSTTSIGWVDSAELFQFTFNGTLRASLIYESSTVKLNLGGGAGGSNIDTAILFASDAFIGWDESLDSISINKDVMPVGTGSLNLGNATTYWNDISAKSFTDRSALWLHEPEEAYNIIKNLENEESEGFCAKVEQRGQHRLKYSCFPDYCWDKALNECQNDIYFNEDIHKINEKSFISRNLETPIFRHGDKIISQGELTNLKVEKKNENGLEVQEISITSEGFDLSAGISFILGGLKKCIIEIEDIKSKLN